MYKNNTRHENAVEKEARMNYTQPNYTNPNNERKNGRRKSAVDRNL